MGKPPAIRQLNARISVATYRRLDAIRATLNLTQGQAIEQAISALDRSLTSSQRRTVRFFLQSITKHTSRG
jgi:hypothetical protein